MTPAFREQMRRLMGLRFAPADLTTHWEALQDVPIAILAEAVTRAQKTRAEFPTPVELRQDADAVAHLVRPSIEDEDRGVDLAQPVTLGCLPDGTPVIQHRVWRYLCDLCSDSGTVSVWCGEATPYTPAWMTRGPCERRKEHLPHEWVQRCRCWDSNPDLIKKRERQGKYADAVKK